MKIKYLLLIFVSFFMALFVFACTDPNQPEDPIKPTVTYEAIETILNTKKNNDEINLEGIVYQVVSNGFFVADSKLGAIFVVVPSTFDKTLKVGDKVKISGQFSYSSNFPQVKNIKSVDVVSSGNALPVQRVDMTIDQINALDTTLRVGSYHKLVNVTGTVIKDVTGMYALMSDDGKIVYFDNNSSLDVLQKYETKRVSLTAVTFKYLSADKIWTLSFNGEENITENALTFAEIKAKAVAYLNEVVAKNVYGVITLPTHHPLLPQVSFTFDVEANEYISILDNVATIKIDNVDHEIVLKVTIQAGEEKEVVDYPIVLKGIVPQTVQEFYANKPIVDMSTVIIKGIVASKARNQSETQRSIIIIDPVTKQTVPVDFGKDEKYITNTSDVYRNIELGDEVLVTGQYKLESRTTLLNVTSVETLSRGNEYAHDFENAYVLNSFESYTEVANNTDKYSGQLVKFDNPFINFSTSSAPAVTNWVRLGYNTEAADAGHGTAKRKFAFLIAAQNENLGSDEWYKSLDIPFINKGAKQFDLEIYAYCLYVSDSYVAFIIPDAQCYKVSDEAQVKIDIKSRIPQSIESGTIELITSHDLVNGAITWTSSNEEVINPLTGAVKEVSENTLVTLTATYKIGEVSYTLNIEITVLFSEALSVSEVIASKEEGDTVKVEGVVVGFAADGNNVESRKGVILKDLANNTLLLVNGIGSLYGVEYPNYVGEENKAIEIGSHVVITGKFHTSTAAISNGPEQVGRLNLDLSEGGKVVVLDKVAIAFNDDVLVVDSNAACAEILSDLTALPFGQVIKFVGTAENPIYFGGSSNTAPINVKVFMHKATDNNGTKYNGKTLSFKVDVNTPNAGEGWHQKYLALPNAFVCPNVDNEARAVIGEVYGVITHLTGTYAQMAIVNIENWKTQPEYQYVEKGILGSLPQTVEVGEFKVELPASTILTGPITWTSTSPLINLETKTVGNVTENTEVTIEGKFTYAGEEKTIIYVVTINAPVLEAPKTVSEILALTADTESIRVKGMVVGFASDGNSDELVKGIILMDNTNGKMILLNDFDGCTYPKYFDANNDLIRIGDEIVVTGNYKLNDAKIGSSGPEQTGRKNIEVNTVNILSSGNELAFHEENAIVINDNQKMTDLFASLETIQYGKLIKLVGTTDNPICVGGSSSSNPFNIKIFFNKDAKVNNDTKYNGKILSLKSNVANANAGSDTWFTDLFGITGPFVGPKDGVLPRMYTGTIYLVITHTTSSYYQANLVNYTNCKVVEIN